MNEDNLKYKLPTSQTYQNPNRFHFSSYVKDSTYNNDTQPKFRDSSISQKVEDEYQQMFIHRNEIKEKGIIDITSEELKREYNKKYTFYNNGISFIFVLSLIVVLCTLIEIKNLVPTELIVSTLILCILSAFISFMLLISLRTKVLIDSYGYITFYLFSMFESLILISLFLLKFCNFIITFKRLNDSGCPSLASIHKSFPSRKKKFKCPGYFWYLLMAILNICIFLGFAIYIKFIFELFLDGFNILILKKKTLFQRQIEINENKGRGGKIEFTDENDNDESKDNSLRELKTK